MSSLLVLTGQIRCLCCLTKCRCLILRKAVLAHVLGGLRPTLLSLKWLLSSCYFQIVRTCAVLGLSISRRCLVHAKKIFPILRRIFFDDNLAFLGHDAEILVPERRIRGMSYHSKAALRLRILDQVRASRVNVGCRGSLLSIEGRSLSVLQFLI